MHDACMRESVRACAPTSSRGSESLSGMRGASWLISFRCCISVYSLEVSLLEEFVWETFPLPPSAA